MNEELIRKVFGAEMTRAIIETLNQSEFENWSMLQIMAFAEGYPAGYPSETDKQLIEGAEQFSEEGWGCHSSRQYKLALDYYSQALALYPDFPMILNNKGLAHYRLQQFDDARQAYEKAITLNPLFIKPLSNMGILYYELKGDEAEARKWFLRALTLNPNYERAKIYFAQLEDTAPDVLMIGTDPELVDGLIEVFKKMGRKAKLFP